MVVAGGGGGGGGVAVLLLFLFLSYFDLRMLVLVGRLVRHTQMALGCRATHTHCGLQNCKVPSTKEKEAREEAGSGVHLCSIVSRNK